MEYNRVNWKDFPDTSTKMSAENFNKMDEGIAEAAEEINANKEKIDELSSELDGKLSTSGGEVTGAIHHNGTVITNTTNGGSTNYCGGTDISQGASLILRGKDQTGIEGRFELLARDSDKGAAMVGYPNGTLIWNGNRLDNVSSIANSASSKADTAISTANSASSNLQDIAKKLLYQLADNTYIIYSDTAGDTASIGGRSCKRTSSEPCIWMLTSQSGTYYGWLCIGMTESAVTLTSTSDYGSSDIKSFVSDGCTFYFAVMRSQIVSGVLTITCNKEAHYIAGDKAFICLVNNINFDTLVKYSAVAKSSSNFKVFYEDTQGSSIYECFNNKCKSIRSRFGSTDGVFALYGGWSNKDFGLFFGQIVKDNIIATWIQSNHMYKVWSSAGTTTCSYVEVKLGDVLTS